ncbi:Isochorismatase hydrolase, partial [Rhizoclosmatium globosum]
FFLCDIQQKFKNHIFAYPAMLGTAKKMIAASSILNVPLLVTVEHMSDKLGKTDSSLILPPSTLIFQKQRFSMVTQEVSNTLSGLYSNKGADHVVLFGIESQVCVLQTTLDLLEKGISVTVLQDGVSSINQGEIPVALERLRQAGAFISTSESVLFQIMQDASHPGFKQIQGLLKETKESSAVALNTFCLPSKL